MKPDNKTTFWSKYKKYLILSFILLGFILTMIITPGIMEGTNTQAGSLPIWQVNNPVSKVFVMDNIPPTAGSLAAGNSTVPDAYLDDPAIDTLLLMMKTQGIYLYKTATHPDGIVGSNDIVIIKGSFQWDFRNTTSTDRIKGLVWQILQHPDGFTGEILVGDNTQWAPIGEDDNNSEDPNQCILDVINTFHSKGYPVYLFRWADIMNNVVTEYSKGDYNNGYTYDPATKISYPKFKSPSGNHYISLRYGIWNSNTHTYNHDRLCLVDFPVLKAHGWTGATLAIKNWVGVLTVAYQNERYGGGDPMHFDYFFSPFALVAKVMQVTYPKLTIIDAAWANPERNYGNIAVQLNMLLGSTDPFAASWYAAKYMLTPVAYYPERTNPDNVGGLYNKCLNNWINCMHDSGFAVTKDSSEISVYDRSVLSAPSVFNLTVNVSDGWNMVSVPGLNPNGMGLGNWWPNRLGDVFKFGNGYEPITTTTPGTGYWMMNNGAQTYNYPAIQIVPHNPINAVAGWNMIGGYELSVASAGITTVPPGLKNGLIYKLSNGYQPATTIDPGYGYWINLTDAGQIIIPETMAKREKSVEWFPQDWPKILLTDNQGRNYTLYCVQDNADLSQYELPPAPPEGMFDVRFETNKIAEKLGTEIKKIHLSGVAYPLTIRTEGIDIRFTDDMGKVLKSNLKSGEELTINNATIKKIGVSSAELPKEYSLDQNYPNPFNPTTTIQFATPKDAQLKINIYNILGENVLTIAEGTYEAGYHKVTFNASSLPSGIYIYSLENSDPSLKSEQRFIQARKMVLIK